MVQPGVGCGTWLEAKRGKPWRTTRQEARAHVITTVKALRDRMIPEDESRPVKDVVFCKWEEMAEEFDREATVALEGALAGLSEQAVDGFFGFAAK